MDKKKITLVYIVAALMILAILGYTYAYFSATVTEDNKTQTVIKTQQLSLTFNGTSEITADDMIPGDSFTKTFTVENTATVKTFYNIYMEGITNEFNEDLVYTLTDEDGIVVAEAPLPVTNTGKSYLIENIEIEPSEIKEYTLTIEYKYLDTPQNDYQGAEFKATVGIDTVKVESQAPEIPKYYAFGLPDTTSPTNYNDVIASSGSNAFVQLEGEQLSVCIYRNSTLECFKNNNYEEESEHLKQVFGEDSCSVDSSYADCSDDAFSCSVDSYGLVGCYDDAAGHICDVNAVGRVICE